MPLLNNLDLLHSFFRGDLYSLLLDSLKLNWHDDINNKDNKDEDETWVDRARHRCLLAIRRFNNWSTKTLGKIPNLDSMSLSKCRNTIDRLQDNIIIPIIKPRIVAAIQPQKATKSVFKTPTK